MTAGELARIAGCRAEPSEPAREIARVSHPEGAGPDALIGGALVGHRA